MVLLCNLSISSKVARLLEQLDLSVATYSPKFPELLVEIASYAGAKEDFPYDVLCSESWDVLEGLLAEKGIPAEKAVPSSREKYILPVPVENPYLVIIPGGRETEADFWLGEHKLLQTLAQKAKFGMHEVSSDQEIKRVFSSGGGEAIKGHMLLLCRGDLLFDLQVEGNKHYSNTLVVV